MSDIRTLTLSLDGSDTLHDIAPIHVDNDHNELWVRATNVESDRVTAVFQIRPAFSGDLPHVSDENIRMEFFRHACEVAATAAGTVLGLALVTDALQLTGTEHVEYVDEIREALSAENRGAADESLDDLRFHVR